MLLVADIGNTSTTVGVYDENTLLKTWKIASDKKRSFDEYGILLKSMIKHADLLDKIDSAIISSVVLQLTETFKQAFDVYLGIDTVVVSSKINTGITYDVENPKKIGADRIANACAAYNLYGKTSVVIDFGTATTFDIVSSDGCFLGGIIAPGIGISAESLSSFTSLLPKVSIEAPKNVVGKNTVDNMLAGLVRGHACMIDGLIEDVEQELGTKVVTIATGGYSNILTDCLKRPFDFMDPNLTLEGLRIIHGLNIQNSIKKTHEIIS